HWRGGDETVPAPLDKEIDELLANRMAGGHAGLSGSGCVYGIRAAILGRWSLRANGKAHGADRFSPSPGGWYDARLDPFRPSTI
ncbi:MAG: hypothetical protein R3236_03050, partial [Phycisphaeraceae bacterium]|nr:hypothetical protein [Phycisphaeraceae bacterium]